MDRDVGGAFVICGCEALLVDGVCGGVREYGVAVEDLNVFYSAVRLDSDAKANRAANSLIAEYGRILRLSLLKDLALAAILGQDDFRPADKDGNQAGDLRESALTGGLRHRARPFR